MKNTIKHLLKYSLVALLQGTMLASISSSVLADFKVGANPGTAPTANTSFESEATDGSVVVITKDTSKLGIGTNTPTANLEVSGSVAFTSLLEGTGTESVVTVDNAGNLTQTLRSSLTGKSNNFSNTILGYDPQPASQRVIPATAPGGAGVTEVGCKTNPSNSHIYCGYQLSTSINFFNSYLFAKQLGGYLVTLTSTAERDWVYNNILNGTTGYNLNNNIWLGYMKIALPGNPTQFQWITGEYFKINWSTNPNATAEHWFDTGEPNNAGGTEGGSHIFAQGANAERRWNDLSPSLTSTNGYPFNQLIIEFNE